MINYKDLPTAPPEGEREEMIEHLKSLPEYTHDEIGAAVAENIKLGYMVILHECYISITKEGYDYFQGIVKTSLN